MKTIQIEAAPRERLGKGGARTLRREGRIPAALYGQGRMESLSVGRKEYLEALAESHGDNVLFDVVISGGDPLRAIVRETQIDVLSREITHLDFHHISMTEKIRVAVAIHLTGEPEGVKTFGGVLEHVTREVEVLCLPSDIPSHLEVDVSGLLIGDSVHVSDLAAYGADIQEESDRVIAMVAAPTVVEEPTEEEEEGEEGAEGAEGAEEGAEKAEGAEDSGDDGAKS